MILTPFMSTFLPGRDEIMQGLSCRNVCRNAFNPGKSSVMLTVNCKLCSTLSVVSACVRPPSPRLSCRVHTHLFLCIFVLLCLVLLDVVIEIDIWIFVDHRVSRALGVDEKICTRGKTPKSILNHRLTAPKWSLFPKASSSWSGS